MTYERIENRITIWRVNHGAIYFCKLWRSTAPLSHPTEPPKRIFPLNQIFFGSPGTGKTYSTISYAVAICNNKKLDDTLRRDYADIKREYA